MSRRPRDAMKTEAKHLSTWNVLERSQLFHASKHSSYLNIKDRFYADVVSLHYWFASCLFFHTHCNVKVCCVLHSLWVWPGGTDCIIGTPSPSMKCVCNNNILSARLAATGNYAPACPTSLYFSSRAIRMPSPVAVTSDGGVTDMERSYLVNSVILPRKLNLKQPAMQNTMAKHNNNIVTRGPQATNNLDRSTCKCMHENLRNLGVGFAQENHKMKSHNKKNTNQDRHKQPPHIEGAHQPS